MAKSDTPVTLISGASRGLGLEFANQLLDAGYRVIATARNIEKAEDLQQLHKNRPDRLQLINLDVGSDASVRAFSKELQITSLDLLISNAGVLLGDESSLEDFSSQDLIDSFNVNALGAIRLVSACLPYLNKSNSPIIANITSRMGSISDNSSGGYYAYRMSKAALNMFNKSLSIDFPKAISVVLHPGWAKTKMGGRGAQISTAESVRAMLQVIGNLEPKDNGKFLNYRGDEIPW